MTFSQWAVFVRAAASPTPCVKETCCFGAPPVSLRLENTANGLRKHRRAAALASLLLLLFPLAKGRFFSLECEQIASG